MYKLSAFFFFSNKKINFNDRKLSKPKQKESLHLHHVSENKDTKYSNINNEVQPNACYSNVLSLKQ